jgi:iron complex outermembrane receptor protein
VGTTNANSSLAALRAANPAFVAIMESDPTAYGDNLRLLNVLQQGFVFDPDTMYETRANYHNVALEKELFARLGLVYFDFVNDVDTDTRMKNQILFDSMDQFKDSELPFAQKQDIYMMEDKFTLEKRVDDAVLPSWLRINTISAINFRHTSAQRYSNTGDYDDRPDLSLPNNVRTPYDTFVTPLENEDYFNGGAPWTSKRKSVYNEAGIGMFTDIQIGERVNIMAGARFDQIWAKTTDKAGRYSLGTDGVINNNTLTGKGKDKGFSYSLSLSYELPGNIIPYITYGQQTSLSDSSDLTFPRNLVEAGPYDPATILEVGIKGSHFDDRLFWSVSAYRQQRSSVTADIGGNPLLGGLGNLKGEGIEFETRFAPNRNFWASGFLVFSKTTIQDTAGWVRVHGDALGFSDVLDPVTGDLLYPAEAFTWGGQAFRFVPAGVNTKVPGYPDTSAGLAAEYAFDNGLSFGASGNYISSVYSGRFQSLRLPSAITINMNVAYKINDWRIKLDVFNVTDEQYFRGRNGLGAGDVLISAMPTRRAQVTVSKRF